MKPIMSSNLPLMYSDLMAATMGVLVVIISMLMINMKDEFEQKIIEMDMVQSEQTGSTPDNQNVINIAVNNNEYIISGPIDHKTYANEKSFIEGLKQLKRTTQKIDSFVVYAPGNTPFQKVIDVTDVVNKHFLNTRIDIGAIEK